MRLNDFVQESSKPRPLYVCRKVVNTDDIISWAKSQGLTSMLEASELHVTICYSKTAMDWDMPKTAKTVTLLPISDFDEDHKPLRKIEMFGKEHNVLVLQIESQDLVDRWKQFIEHGASHDFPNYKSHITISYLAKELAEEIEFIEPYLGEIVFGPEIFKEIEQDFAGDAEEIDLTKPLDELLKKKSKTRDEVAEKYTEIVGENEVLIENIEWAGRVRVTVNPSLMQLENLCEVSDIRGVCAGNEVFIWDANQGTHLDIMHNLGISSDCYANRFYAWMPEYGETDDDWGDRESSWMNSQDNARIKIGGVVICVRRQVYSHLLGMRSFANMIKDRRTAMTEAVDPEKPKYFWIITDIPTTVHDEWKEHDERRLREMSSGVLTGVKGISATREIICQMLDSKGNTAIMMNGADVMQYNNIERVRYEDPDYLASNNMHALYRLWEKNPEKKYGKNGLMMNLYGYFSKMIAKKSPYLGHRVYEMINPVSDMFEAEPSTVNTADDVGQLIYDLMQKVVASTALYYRYRAEEIADVTLEMAKEGAREALLYTGRIYADEGEWLVKSSTFRIPPGSKMLVSMTTEARRAALDGDLSKIPPWNQYTVKNAKIVLEKISQYNFESHYDVRFIPREKFEQIRHVVQNRRRESRPPLA
jgi:hypothetical protein